MTQEQLRSELAELGVIILRGSIPNFSAENPIEMHALETVGPCSIGAFTYGANLFLHYADIGRFCSIAPDVCKGLGNHRTDLFSTHPFAVKGGSQFSWHNQFAVMRKSISQAETVSSTYPRTTIGNDVWIGRGVLINDNVTVGDGAIIGAGAVVTSDIPDFAIAVGVPAKVVRFRFGQDVIERFLSVRWWDLDLSHIGKIAPEPLAFLKIVEAALLAGDLPKLSVKAITVGPKSDG